MDSIPAKTDKKKLLPRLLGKFIETESAGGLVMIGCLVLASLCANSPLRDWYQSFIYAPIEFGYGEYHIISPLKEWVKDVLMVFFFLVVAMELKTEMCEGFLSQPGQVRLPLLAALGGVAVPALIYLTLNQSQPEYIAGWAIPTATDIAFALAILLMAGKHIPPSAKIFLLAIAIFDDLFAILIIAFFYTGGLAVTPLWLAIAGIAMLLLLNHGGVTQLTPYALVGIYLWFCFHNAGIHTTIAGVAVGMAIPLHAENDQRKSPLRHCMHLLHGWVVLLVLPLFAFTSAGIDFKGMTLEMLFSPVPLGIALGLFFGKQIGIFGTTWLLVRLRLVLLPAGMGWWHVYGVSLVAGVGFTMSLFIGLLAFDDPNMQYMVKAGVIGGSTLASLAGYLVLRYCTRPAQAEE